MCHQAKTRIAAQRILAGTKAQALGKIAKPVILIAPPDRHRQSQIGYEGERITADIAGNAYLVTCSGWLVYR
jgi:hypothetical protein